MTLTAEQPIIGQPTPLIDGHGKVTGHMRFIADLKLPGMLYAHMIGSDYAHANIINIHKEDALAVPGVVAVITHEDLPNIAPSSRARLLLARGRTIFFGQPVALVLATSEAAASDGAERVFVEYEPLAAAASIDSAMAEDAPIVWSSGVPGRGNDDMGAHGADAAEGEVEETKSVHSNIMSDTLIEEGDIEKAFAQSAHFAEHIYSTPVVHQNSIETHGVIAQPDPMTGGMNIWSSTQGPFDVRKEVAELLGVPESDVQVTATPVGGGFGGKFGLYEVLTALTAQAVGKPVRLILSRMNELSATNPAPEMRVTAKMGTDAEGNITALEAEIIVDAGCYPSGYGNFASYMMRAFYSVPVYKFRVINVVTFKPSAGAYRAPVAPTATYVMDTLIDELAEKLSMDSIEMRLRNIVQTGDILPNGRAMPTIGSNEVLHAVQSHPLWQNRESLREQGYGVGVAIGGWFGGIEPGAAVCKVNRDGLVHIHVGSVDLTGTTTTYTMLAAETFGVSADKIRVIFSGTDTAPYSGGTGGSKITYSMSGAVVQAAEMARQQTLEIAAEEFEADVADLDIVDGQVQVKGFPEKKLGIGEIAAKTMHFGGKYAPIFAHGRSAMENSAPGFSAQLVQVKVDEDTGMVHVVKHVAAQDVGKALNPMAVEGQMMGGAVQGLGWALYEEMRYDEHTGQLISGTWMDYNLPSAKQAGDSFEAIIVEVPSDEGYLGIRGVGEPPVVPTGAAVTNAIAHATGIRMSQLPMTPPRVFEALNNRHSESGY